MLAIENRMYGLTTLDARCLSYQLAEINDIARNFSHQNKAAGKDWLRGFRLRHPQLSLRLPESTSVALAMGFNKPVKSTISTTIRLIGFLMLMKLVYVMFLGKTQKLLHTWVSRTTSADRGSSTSAVMCASAAEIIGGLRTGRNHFCMQ
ncbi:hypothetical protein PR048_015546 [Dryococelus australis]|uniref:HTH CENPB-type domain-containing protein n=1 Tax=Dryococelus australis TaxID=614101 RepID=A0ABQ9HH70_9NEOP|nr:hypothetical protein PR048_015546 [Dryococelus australis]